MDCLYVFSKLLDLHRHDHYICKICSCVVLWLEKRVEKGKCRNRKIESRNRKIESRNRKIESRNRNIESRNRNIESRNRKMES